jgi:LmbE family N-acetylglucosaminyl deacetylase
VATRVLVVAPHPDDETIGAGGTIAKHSAQGDEVTVMVVSGHLPPLYDREHYERTVREAERACRELGVHRSRFLEIPTGLIGAQPPGAVNGQIAAIVEELEPEIVLCPFPDRHIDHRLVFDSVMVATRPRGAGRQIRLLAAYETLSETHWLAPSIEANFTPNLIVDVSEIFERKLKAVRCYESQIPAFPDARSVEAIEALAKFRGTQAGFAFGEAFQVIRMIR